MKKNLELQANAKLDLAITKDDVLAVLMHEKEKE